MKRSSVPPMLVLTLACMALVLAEPAGAQTESVLYNFCSLANCADGQQPVGNIVRDSEGNIYGTTLYGGQYGQGVLYRVTPAGIETVLHNFSGTTYDGEGPTGLVADGDRAFFVDARSRMERTH